jgi:hypothetical protein
VEDGSSGRSFVPRITTEKKKQKVTFSPREISKYLTLGIKRLITTKY